MEFPDDNGGSGDLDVTYADLRDAAKAAKAAAKDIETALTTFKAKTVLGGDDFTKKGDDVLTWYDGSRTNYVKLLGNSHTSFGQFETAFATAALLFEFVDEHASTAAGKKGH